MKCCEECIIQNIGESSYSKVLLGLFVSGILCVIGVTIWTWIEACRAIGAFGLDVIATIAVQVVLALVMLVFIAGEVVMIVKMVTDFRKEREQLNSGGYTRV